MRRQRANLTRVTEPDEDASTRDDSLITVADSGVGTDLALDRGGDMSGAGRRDMTWAGETSFCRLPLTRDLTNVDIAVLGIPFDNATTNRPGARFGPRAIREQSLLSGEFPSGLWPWNYDVFAEHRVVDYGDVSFAPGYTDQMLANTESTAATIIDAGGAVLGLGGDHLIAYPLIRAAASRFGPLSLVHLDAHSDTWDAGEELNHGTMFLRAAREGLIDPARSVQIGMRTPNVTHGFHVIHADELFRVGIDGVVERVREVVGDRPAYLTFDIDFLDPAYAPGTGTPVIGGPTSWQARQLLFGLSGMHFVGADLVEVAPIYDPSGQITALAGATIAHDQLHLLAAARGGSPAVTHS